MNIWDIYSRDRDKVTNSEWFKTFYQNALFLSILQQRWRQFYILSSKYFVMTFWTFPNFHFHHSLVLINTDNVDYQWCSLETTIDDESMNKWKWQRLDIIGFRINDSFVTIGSRWWSEQFQARILCICLH